MQNIIRPIKIDSLIPVSSLVGIDAGGGGGGGGGGPLFITMISCIDFLYTLPSIL